MIGSNFQMWEHSKATNIFVLGVYLGVSWRHVSKFEYLPKELGTSDRLTNKLNACPLSTP